MTNTVYMEDAVIFCVHQPVVSAIENLKSNIYKLLIGKDGTRWVVACVENAADYVYCDGGKGSQGFGGRTLEFELEDGSKVAFEGPWQCDAAALLEATGYDVTDKKLVRGIIAEERTDINNSTILCKKVHHYDVKPVLRNYYTIHQKAEALANKLNKPIYWAQVSIGGSVISIANPKKEEVHDV